jgi:hypothetical protein
VPTREKEAPLEELRVGVLIPSEKSLYYGHLIITR